MPFSLDTVKRQAARAAELDKTAEAKRDIGRRQRRSKATEVLEDREFIRHEIAGVRIPLGELLRELRAVVGRAGQELVAPIIGHARLPLVVFVETDKVGRVAQARKHKLETDPRHIHVDITINKRVIRADTKS